ncbi:F-box/FBD/LRR-repeat protein [Panicum miliaceum]|uniref:F-box/FBD/LRR-repeat protein n=1 Tax=Panicum miliaceum TaxID=4540 RepID=A0A3L6T478_PANMI|nr:F-box/FBD/LRR-repeat protein [Panicum miliaceum]
MQLRSGRRLVTPPAPAPRGGVPQARPRHIHADREDRLSGLPVELRLEVLARLGCPREAARTSVLSRRWRGLWTELRDLKFDGVDRDQSFAAALAMVRPELDRLRLCLRGRRAAARISLLRAADRLAPAELQVSLEYNYYDRTVIEMPLFKRATSIDLFIGRYNISLPPAGDFDKLEQLALLCEPQCLPSPLPATAQARDDAQREFLEGQHTRR